jgi:hypothetical protein
MFEALTILQLCIKGNFICERDADPPKIKYFEPDMACYVKGEFYSKCSDFKGDRF